MHHTLDCHRVTKRTLDEMRWTFAPQEDRDANLTEHRSLERECDLLYVSERGLQWLGMIKIRYLYLQITRPWTSFDIRFLLDLSLFENGLLNNG